MSIQAVKRVMCDTQEYLQINGGVRLDGSVRISGAKNSCLPVMAATLLASGECHIQNVPRLKDVFTLIDVLKRLGATAEWSSNNSLVIDTTEVSRLEPDINLVRKMRASVLVMGPLLARFGHVVMPMPGGCSLGARPIDLHIAGMEAMGGVVEDAHEAITVKKNDGGRLNGARIRLRFPSVGATENILMAATLADGTTIIENAAMEPEIVDLADFLVSQGAYITGAGEETITVVGVEELHPAKHTVIPDRIEAATYLIAGAITAGNITLTSVRPDHMGATLEKLTQAGCKITIESDTVKLDAPDVLRSVDIRTLTYPGFSTDVQPPFMALMTKASGDSLFVEKIFERRFLLSSELNRMGAETRVLDNCALVNGGSRLSGCEVNSPDIRAAAALVVAALWAEGTTTIRGLQHLYRGYESIEEKLAGLGADIKAGGTLQDGRAGATHATL